jgi:hypothetical protein
MSRSRLKLRPTMDAHPNHEPKSERRAPARQVPAMSVHHSPDISVHGRLRLPKTDAHRSHEPPPCSAVVPTASCGGVSPPVPGKEASGLKGNFIACSVRNDSVSLSSPKGGEDWGEEALGFMGSLHLQKQRHIGAMNRRHVAQSSRLRVTAASRRRFLARRHQDSGEISLRVRHGTKDSAIRLTRRFDSAK